MTIGDFCGTIAPLIFESGGSVSSWIRSKKFNDSLAGSVQESWHLVGLAVDVHSFRDAMSKSLFMRRCRRKHFDVVDEGTHVHVEAH
jgi:hypothetical protein